MSAAAELTGRVLIGRKTGKSWRVIEKKNITAGNTPGAFSIGYIVEDDNKNQAFMKASDLGMFTQPGFNILETLTRASNAHSFERKILDHCHGNNMDRVVTALDYNDVEIVHHGTRDIVFFLIFEKAESDMRKHVTQQGAFDLLWSVTTLHNLFVATSQLHTALVAHNDIKPANMLVFSKDIQKVADLGRATSSSFPANHDSLQCAGDLRFASPEQLYPIDLNCEHLPLQTRRVAGDLYNLGSLAHYVLSARMTTPEIILLLRPEQRPRNKSGGSQDSYQSALPYWMEAFASLVARLKDVSAQQFGPGVDHEITNIINIVVQLCEPDPTIRGHPKNRGAGQNQYGLQRYITELAATKARLAVKAA